MVMQVQAELAEELRSVGLKTTGSKADLVDRLQQHLSSQSTDNAAVSAFDDMSDRLLRYSRGLDDEWGTHNFVMHAKSL